jgi:hypothetical protein
VSQQERKSVSRRPSTRQLRKRISEKGSRLMTSSDVTRPLSLDEVYAVVKESDSTAITWTTALYHTLSAARPTAPINPRSEGSRLVHLGYKIFLLALLTYWNAGIVRMLVQESLDQNKPPTAGFADLSDAIRQRVRLCAHGSLGRSMAAATDQLMRLNAAELPLLASLLVLEGPARGPWPYSSVGSMRAANEGLCSGVITELGQLHAVVSNHGNDFCRTTIVGTDVREPTPIALPVRTEVEPLVSYMIAQFLANGLYDAELARATSVDWPTLCTWAVTTGATPPAPQSASPVLQVGVSQFATFFGVLLGFSVVGVLVALCPCGSVIDHGKPGGLC